MRKSPEYMKLEENLRSLLIGAKIAAVRTTEEGTIALLLTRNGAPEVTVYVLRDEEGNGGGVLEVETDGEGPIGRHRCMIAAVRLNHATARTAGEVAREPRPSE